MLAAMRAAQRTHVLDGTDDVGVRAPQRNPSRRLVSREVHEQRNVRTVDVCVDDADALTTSSECERCVQADGGLAHPALAAADGNNALRGTAATNLHPSIVPLRD